MKFYIKVDSAGNQVGNPMLYENLRYLCNEGESFEQCINRLNYKPIIDKAPELGYNQRGTIVGFSKKEDGSFTNDYEVITLSNKDIIDEVIRRRRNFELITSDWTQLPDAPFSESKKIEWAVYRQQLRDMPADYIEFTADTPIVWPTKPT